jgi:hypothetical protein
MKKSSTGPIIIKFERTNVLTRWHCHVCGGCTEKDLILCESNGANDDTVRVCPECLRSGNIDERLEETAQRHENDAAGIRALKGRLIVPTYEQWEQATQEADLDDYLDRTTNKTWDEIQQMTPEERAAARAEMDYIQSIEKHTAIHGDPWHPKY